MISLVLMALGVQISFAPPQGEQEQQVAKVKAQVAKLREGGRPNAIVRLKDGKTLRGHVTISSDERFTLVTKPATIPFTSAMTRLSR
jgi:hypothetical protein